MEIRSSRAVSQGTRSKPNLLPHLHKARCQIRALHNITYLNLNELRERTDKRDGKKMEKTKMYRFNAHLIAMKKEMNPYEVRNHQQLLISASKDQQF